ncbi:MAG TPA: dipeptidase [Chloroflexia bacterium]|nr:dipeptidase [Chloroflexia bacterium]
MTAASRLLVLDGHNDTLLQLYQAGPGGPGAFLTGDLPGHLDLPRARAGGFAGGFFAIFVPPPGPPPAPDDDLTITATGYSVRLADPIDPGYAQQVTLAVAAGLFRLERESGGQVQVVRTTSELAACLQRGTLGVILHFEGAEAIDPGLDALEVFYQAGLRSLGLVWSRPNVFAHGVPFRFPHSPDTGPGLTAAGRALVRACNALGILVDLAHLNEQGFWDVARLSSAPLVATHTAAHALCPSTRNLTDAQLAAIAASDGLVGLNFGVNDLRADGALDAATPLAALVRHCDYLVAHVGIDRVAFGSDFDGTTIPEDIGDVAGLPKLIAALRAHGYDEPALRKLAHENWLRVLGQTWHDPR